MTAPTLTVRGTIPARAGSTPSLHDFEHAVEDHPRSRGEHLCSHGRRAAPTGPSPLARGALQLRRVERDDDGTIPARAGSTP